MHARSAREDARVDGTRAARRSALACRPTRIFDIMARASEKVQYSAEVGVAIDEIDRHLRPASQMRVQLDLVAVAEYAENLDQLPAVKVMHDPAIGKHWVVDGAHTITAYGRCGEQEVRAVVATGSYDDAYREASRCNGKRGVRLYDVDYRHRILQYAEELRRANDERLWALVRQGSGHSTPEDRARFRRGAVDTVERLIAAHPGQRIAAVTHGGVINAYLSHILELGARDVFEPRYTGVARILASRAGHRNIDSLNETHHLPRSWLK